MIQSKEKYVFKEEWTFSLVGFLYQPQGSIKEGVRPSDWKGGNCVDAGNQLNSHISLNQSLSASALLTFSTTCEVSYALHSIKQHPWSLPTRCHQDHLPWSRQFKTSPDIPKCCPLGLANLPWLRIFLLCPLDSKCDPFALIKWYLLLSGRPCRNLKRNKYFAKHN